MRKVILAGNAVTASIMLGYLAYDQRYTVLSAVVDDEFVQSGIDLGIDCAGIGEICQRFDPSSHSVLMAVGYGDLNRARQSLFERLKKLGYAIEAYVHPDARVYTRHPLGEGSVILPGAVIEPNARVGEDTFVWCNATVAHDSTVADHCWIASGAVIAGHVSIGRNTFVGVNATVVDQITVGEFNIIGGSAMISKSTKPNTVHLARTAEIFRYGADDYVKFFRS
jgi:sugar O-acyltransferase (sialic acid O-acetyltransferase NeuD family)